MRLWIGARTAAHLPYADRFGLWERAGVKVTPVFSQVHFSPSLTPLLYGAHPAACELPLLRCPPRGTVSGCCVA